MYKTIFALVIALFAGIASAFATPLAIDFTSAAWSSANGRTQDTVGNVTATSAYPPGSALTWSSAGVGIRAPGLLALSPIDILNISFANGSGNGLTGSLVTNLFSGSWESGVLELITTTGTDYFNLTGLNSTGNVYTSFGGAVNVLAAEFWAVNPTGQLFSQGYSVAGFTRSVPDGGTTVALLGISLIGLTALRCRFAV
jgi:VPDSG-CTERM motif